MFRVQSVEIDGFWGSYELKTNLYDDVNIFIGPNGSGKTTFINFLEATLTADLDLLASLQFKEIRLLLKNERKTRKISIRRVPDINYDKLLFKIGSRSPHELLLISRETEYRRRGVHPKYIEAINEVRSSLAELINISWLSVHRELLEDEYRDPYTRRTTTEKNPVDRRIDDLMKRFTQYQLKLQSEINRESDDFRKKVLASMLYSREFDEFHIEQEAPDFKSVKDGLVRTYKDLGVLDRGIESKIGEHISKIKKSIKAMKAFRSKQAQITIDDILPLSLLRRTEHVVNLSTYMDRKKIDILKPVNTYLDILRNFAKDKEFRLNPNLSGELLIRKGSTLLPLEQLSSGEKQLFILLTEALLQEGKRFVFIADEPELSLHIEWQKKILRSIRTLNQNSQIIVATHAPEIAGGWRDKIIKMKEIIHE